MFKKITLSLMLSVFCTHQSLAGSGLSTPVEQEPENHKKAARKPTPNHNRDEGGGEVFAGLAALTIGGVATAYLLHQAFKEPESKPTNSSNVEKNTVLANSSKTEVKRPNQGQPRDTFHYQNENFSAEAWKKEHELENNFPFSKKNYETKGYSRSNIISSSVHSNENAHLSEEAFQEEGCPIMGLLRAMKF